MTEDILKRATEALREEGGEPNPRSGATRARLLDSAEKRYAGGRRWLLRWSVAAASMFVVGTALARVAEYWPELREAISLAPSAPDKTLQHRKLPAKRAPQPPAPSSVASPEAQPSEPAQPQPQPAIERAPAPTYPVVRAPRPRPAARHALEAPQPTPTASSAPEPAALASSAPSAGRSAELDLFRRALALHTSHDPAALSAWDAYLRVVDHGVLVPEARYNRALCLVRLGRTAQARSALEPFARGDFGDYRRAEAQALLRALSQ